MNKVFIFGAGEVSVFCCLTKFRSFQWTASLKHNFSSCKQFCIGLQANHNQALYFSGLAEWMEYLQESQRPLFPVKGGWMVGSMGTLRLVAKFSTDASTTGDLVLQRNPSSVAIKPCSTNSTLCVIGRTMWTAQLLKLTTPWTREWSGEWKDSFFICCANFSQSLHMKVHSEPPFCHVVWRAITLSNG